MIKIIIILILLLLIIYFLNKSNNINEKFDNNILTDDERKIIKELSPHILAIKNLSDLANNLMTNGSLTVPGGLKIIGDLTVDGKTVLNNITNINSNLNIDKDANIKGILNIDKDVNMKGIVNIDKDININGITKIKSLNINNFKTFIPEDIFDLFNIQTGYIKRCADNGLAQTCYWKVKPEQIYFKSPFKKIPKIILVMSDINGINLNASNRRGLYLPVQNLLGNITNSGFIIDFSRIDSDEIYWDKTYSFMWIALPNYLE
jgi:hypothetical protein